MKFKYPQTENLVGWLTAIYVFTLPLFFLPKFADFYVLPKSLLSLTLLALLVAAIATDAYTKKQLHFLIKPLHFPMGLLLLAFLFSTYMQSPNPTEAWIFPGIMLFSTSIFAFLASNWMTRSNIVKVKIAIITTSSILSLITIYQILGLTSQVGGTFTWLSNKMWNPTGSPLSLLFVIFSGIIVALVWALRKPAATKTGVLLFSVLLQAIAMATALNELLPGKPYSLMQLPYAFAYSISIDVLKNWRTALIGVGPDNYLAAFTQFKPLAYNSLEKLWNIRFASSSNEILQAMTTMGLLGLAAWLWLVFGMTKQALGQWKKNTEWALLAIFSVVFVFLFALNTSSMMWFFGLLTVLLAFSRPIKEFRITSLGEISLIVALLTIGLAIGIFNSYKFSIGEINFRNSLLSLRSNDGVKTYDYQKKAIIANPHRIGYRVAYSKTNLALATAMAKQQDLTEQDSKQIVKLIQQGVREARAAVQINPKNVNSWENLAGTYRELTNFANNANQFALQSYAQAIRLDPKNPRLLLDYGSLLLANKQLDPAINVFRQSVALKNDYANAHFNLANAYIADGKLNQGYQELKMVISLLEPNTQDYYAVTKQAEQLKEKISQSPDSKTDAATNKNDEPTLTTPSPVPQKPEKLELINLQDENTPPLDTPSATPTANVTPSVSPANQ